MRFKGKFQKLEIYAICKNILCFWQIACSVFWVFTLLELESMKLEFHWHIFLRLFSLDVQANSVSSRLVALFFECSYWWNLSFIGKLFFFPWTCRQTLFQADCLLCFLTSGTRVYETWVSLGIFFFLDIWANQKLKCVHTTAKKQR